MKILATSYGGSHIKTIEPILTELTMRGHECIYMPQTVASIDVALGIKSISFLDYANKNDSEILKYGKKLAIRHHNMRVMPYDESVVYLGTIFKELVSQVGEDYAWGCYKEIGLRACNPIQYMINLINIERPDFVIATNAPRMERALLNAAVVKRIPNICVVDFQGLRAIDWLKSELSCSHIAVGAQVTIDNLIENGRSPKSIHFTGSPLFENINKSEVVLSAEKWRMNNKLEKQKIILFIEQPDFKFPNLPDQIRSNLSEICINNNYKLVTRFHPSQNREKGTEYRGELISEASDVVEVIVNACDVCVTMTSTVGWMALMANKPLININLSSTSNYISITEEDGALQLYSLESLEDAIRLLLSENTLSAKLENNRIKIRKFGDSAKKIAALVEKIHGNKNEVE